jgi:hypothetical protein
MFLNSEEVKKLESTKSNYGCGNNNCFACYPILYSCDNCGLFFKNPILNNESYFCNYCEWDSDEF